MDILSYGIKYTVQACAMDIYSTLSIWVATVIAIASRQYMWPAMWKGTIWGRLIVVWNKIMTKWPTYFLQMYMLLWVYLYQYMYSHKHRADYTTVHHMVHTTCMLHTTNKKSQMVSFLIAGHIYTIITLYSSTFSMLVLVKQKCILKVLLYCVANI